MTLSALTGFVSIPERSEATPGLFNRGFQSIQDNLTSLWTSTNSVIGSGWASTNTLQPESGNTILILNAKALVGRSHQSGVGIFDVRAFGATGDGVTDDSLPLRQAISAASVAGGGVVQIPNGTYLFTGPLVVPNDTVIQGRNWATVTLKNSSTTDGLLIINPINSSGFGRSIIEGLTVTTAVAANTGAACDVSAGGYSYYHLRNCRFTGTHKYGVILDGAEISTVKDCIIDNAGSTSVTNGGTANVWIVNGPQHRTSQSFGYSNVLLIENCELGSAGTGYGIVDDGGDRHTIRGNNFDSAAVSVRVCGAQALILEGNAFESHSTFGDANVVLDDRVLSDGTNVNIGPVIGGSISNNNFAGDVAASGVLLRPQASGSTIYHRGLHIKGNLFGNQLNRTGAIDLTQLDETCFVGPNADSATGIHYQGAHYTLRPTLMTPAPQTTADSPRAAVLSGDTLAETKLLGGLRIGDLQSFTNTFGVSNILSGSTLIGSATYNLNTWTYLSASTIGVAGSILSAGDHVMISANANTFGLVLVGSVTADGVVTASVYNPTGGNKTVATTDWYARVIKGS